MFHVAQGPNGLVWTDEERAALQAFLSNFVGEEGVSVSILEAGEGDRSLGGSRVLSEGAGFWEEELEHDMMGCRDCWVHGDIVYCKKSKYHLNHPHHRCPPWQNCYCLAPEYSSDLSAPHPNLY